MVMALRRSNYVTVGVSYIFVLLISGFVVSDVAKDRDECATQLVGLATCLPYVGGTAKAPTIDCCTGLKQVLQKSKKCLCVLVKDRNDPELGLNINATLALGLPSACHAPANISECPALLHLAPNSPDAQVFEQFAKGSSTPAATGSGSSGSAASSSATSSDSSSAQVKSDGGRGKRWWWGVEMISGVLLWSLTSLLLISA